MLMCVHGILKHNRRGAANAQRGWNGQQQRLERSPSSVNTAVQDIMLDDSPNTIVGGQVFRRQRVVRPPTNFDESFFNTS